MWSHTIFLITIISLTNRDLRFALIQVCNSFPPLCMMASVFDHRIHFTISHLSPTATLVWFILSFIFITSLMPYRGISQPTIQSVPHFLELRYSTFSLVLLLMIPVSSVFAQRHFLECYLSEARAAKIHFRTKSKDRPMVVTHPFQSALGCSVWIALVNCFC